MQTKHLPQPGTLLVAASDSVNRIGAAFVCDGTNDEVQIQAAIDALPSMGGRVILTEGNFSIGASVTIDKNDVVLEGQGKGTKIKLADSTDQSIIVMGGSTQHYRTVIKGIYFDGNHANQSGAMASGDIDNYNASHPVSGVLITECYFVNSYQNAVASQVFASAPGIAGTTINNCIFQNWKGQTGTSNSVIDFEDYPLGGTISNCIFMGNVTTGSVIYDGNLVTAAQNNIIRLPSGYNDYAIAAINIAIGNQIFASNVGASFVGIRIPFITQGNYISLSGAGNVASVGIAMGGNNAICEDNVISGSLGIGIQVAADGQTISGNLLQSCLINGIDSSANAYGKVNITNNTFQNCAKNADNTTDVIYIHGNNQNCIISGNIIYTTAGNNPRYGINESSGNKNIITNNQALNCDTGGINTTGGSTVVANNITA
jgi:hypothetical protein